MINVRSMHGRDQVISINEGSVAAVFVPNGGVCEFTEGYFVINVRSMHGRDQVTLINERSMAAVFVPNGGV